MKEKSEEETAQLWKCYCAECSIELEIEFYVCPTLEERSGFYCDECAKGWEFE